MPLLKEAQNETAFFKGGVYGGPGSGKSMTTALLMIGLAKLSGHDRIAYFDTETGSDFLLPLFRRYGIKPMVAKSRTFADLITFMEEASAAGLPSQVDSITHVWNDLRESYERKLKRTKGLEIWDWGKIKPEWRRFTDLYLKSPIHIVICGRAGNVYEETWNEEKGKKEVSITGTKMSAEKEMSYEPSLLFELEREPRGQGVKGWTHLLTVLKDRFDLINGEEFRMEKDDRGRFLINGKPAKTDNHVLEILMPHIECLNLGGSHVAFEIQNSTEDLFDSPESAVNRRRQVEITLELIEEALALAGMDSRSSAAKKQMAETLIFAFGTSAWTAIKNMVLEDLQAGLEKLRIKLGQKEGAGSPQEVQKLTDSLMDFVANCTPRGGDATDAQRERIKQITSRCTELEGFLYAGLMRLAEHQELGKNQAGAIVGKLKLLQMSMFPLEVMKSEAEPEAVQA